MSRAAWPACLLAAACACGRGGAAGAPAVDSGHPPPAVLRVERGTLADRMVLTGELEAISSESLIVPRTPNWTVSVSWLANEGAVVKKGERVVEFDSSTLAGTLEEKRIAVQRAEMTLASEEARVAGALAEKAVAVERQRAELDKAGVEATVPADLVARRDYQKKQLDLDQRRDALAKAEQELQVQQQTGQLDIRVKQVARERAERDLASLLQQLSELTLRAPRDGIVQLGLNDGRKFLVGDQATPPTVIASLPDLSAMQVRAKLSDVDDGTVRVGMSAECFLDAHPRKLWHGTVQQVSPLARPEGKADSRRYFDVIITLQDKAADLMRPGMSVRVEVIRRRAENALLVPRMALPSWPGKQPVHLSSGALTDVEVDFCTALACVVRGPLPEGTELRAAAPREGQTTALKGAP